MFSIGSSTIGGMYVGSAKIVQAYVGSTLVFQLPAAGYNLRKATMNVEGVNDGGETELVYTDNPK